MQTVSRSEVVAAPAPIISYWYVGLQDEDLQIFIFFRAH